jgi:hypothetical protein
VLQASEAVAIQARPHTATVTIVPESSVRARRIGLDGLPLARGLLNVPLTVASGRHDVQVFVDTGDSLVTRCPHGPFEAREICGPTIVYACLQAIGGVNDDDEVRCPRFCEVQRVR